MTNHIIIITGQTATGKTKLALEYAKKFNAELINCDSRQIYRYLDIITGKDKHLLNRFKIWLYDVVNPNEYFSSYDFVKLAIPTIKKILLKGKTPIITGGTYLYLKHLLYGVDTENIPPNWKLRKKLANKSVEELQKTLKSFNLSAFHNLNQSERSNPQRLIRKIEILSHRAKRQDFQHPRLETSQQQSGKESQIVIEQKLAMKNLEVKFIGLKFKNKESLRKAIEKRVGERLKRGAIEEAEKLLRMGYSESDPGLKTIGYQQLILHLKGVLDVDTVIQQWIAKEIQYAKRQYTFMKRDKNISWREV